jgi:hypothetical protein
MVATLSELSLVIGTPRNDAELRLAARSVARIIADEPFDITTRTQLMAQVRAVLARRWLAAGIKRDTIVEDLDAFSGYVRGWIETRRKRVAR